MRNIGFYLPYLPPVIRLYDYTVSALKACSYAWALSGVTPNIGSDLRKYPFSTRNSAFSPVRKAYARGRYFFK